VLDGTADCAAVVAILERTFRRTRQRLEKIPRVQLVLAQELIERSMHLVGAGFDDRVDHCSCIAAVLGGPLRLNTEFG
jgi:hypothetical protein